MDKTAVAALVGGTSLLGRDIRDLLAGTRIQTKLIGSDEADTGLITEEQGEPVVMTALDADNLAGAKVAILAGSAASSRKTVEMVRRLKPGPALIDLTYVLEENPAANLRAPMVEPANYLVPPEAEHVIAHPAAIVLALFLERVHQIQPVRRAIAHVFEPASERGQRGLDELQKQTVNLLTFQKLPKEVYDEQIAFNLLARYGSEAVQSMEMVELRIEKHLATLLAISGQIPMPSIRLIQAPVFHGHSISIWVEFEANPNVPALEKGLAGTLIDVRGADVEAPTIVGVAGQSGISVGAIAADRNEPRAAWFWIAADNIRVMAENAVGVARSLAGPAGGAKPQ